MIIIHYIIPGHYLRPMLENKRPHVLLTDCYQIQKLTSSDLEKRRI